MTHIFLEKIFETLYSIFSFRHADQVSIGDEVLVEENDDMMPAKVVNVSTLVLQGTEN